MLFLIILSLSNIGKANEGRVHKKALVAICHRSAFSSKAVPIISIWQVFWLVRLGSAFPCVYIDAQWLILLSFNYWTHSSGTAPDSHRLPSWHPRRVTKPGAKVVNKNNMTKYFYHRDVVLAL